MDEAISLIDGASTKMLGPDDHGEIQHFVASLRTLQGDVALLYAERMLPVLKEDPVPFMIVLATRAQNQLAVEGADASERLVQLQVELREFGENLRAAQRGESTDLGQQLVDWHAALNPDNLGRNAALELEVQKAYEELLQAQKAVSREAGGEDALKALEDVDTARAVELVSRLKANVASLLADAQRFDGTIVVGSAG